jgi:hypothetical protein
MGPIGGARAVTKASTESGPAPACLLSFAAITAAVGVDSSASSTEEFSVDGRFARSARTRLAIVDALRALNQAGDVRPTAARVAERAGVSLRTVWQHFDDLESLLLEAGQRDFEVVMQRIEKSGW